MPLKTIYKHAHLASILEVVKLFRYLLTKLNKVSVLYSQISNAVSLPLQNRVMLVFVGYVAWGKENPVETYLPAFDRILKVD